MEIRVVPYNPANGDLLLWPDSVDSYWADAACTIRSPYTRENWGYTYRRLQDLQLGPTLKVGLRGPLASSAGVKPWRYLGFEP